MTTVSDWKTGYCKGSPFSGRDFCCTPKSPLSALANTGETCEQWHYWTNSYSSQFAVYVAFALLFGVVSGAVTLLTKAELPSTAPGQGDSEPMRRSSMVADNNNQSSVAGGKKSLYMAAGSGIPEIKTVLSGFVIPGLLDAKVLLVKAVGSIFAVSTGMCLGKEGPFVHISVCVAHLIGSRFAKYAHNGRKIREVYAAGCAAGLSVAFGAPIGGVLFAYEEIATYFPRKVMWRAFICSLCAAITLRQLDPTGTGRLVLFETDWGASYKLYHYPVFVLLGILGGTFGGLFCKFNFAWSGWFRSHTIIKNHPVLEIFLVVLATALLQYPNPLTREPGDVIIKNLLINCSDRSSKATYVCIHERNDTPTPQYLAWLLHGSLTKLLLTILTFGIKVPSGIIIPALDAGAFTGRLLGHLPFLSTTINPGILAMVSAGAFLAGVSRMTISLAVIMFELTGSLEYTVPSMLAIMTAKWTADALSPEGGVYDLAQTVLGHPFLDLDAAMPLVQRTCRPLSVAVLIPPSETMREITVAVARGGCVPRRVLEDKLHLLRRRGLLDAGLVLVTQQTGMLLGYLGEGELEFGLGLNSGGSYGCGRHPGPVECSCSVRLLAHDNSDHGERHGGRDGHGHDENEQEGIVLDLSGFVDRTPLTISEAAPLEYAVDMFGKLGLRYLMVTQQEEDGPGLGDGTGKGQGRLVGVIIKKRLVDFLEKLKDGDVDV